MAGRAPTGRHVPTAFTPSCPPGGGGAGVVRAGTMLGEPTLTHVSPAACRWDVLFDRGVQGSLRVNPAPSSLCSDRPPAPTGFCSLPRGRGTDCGLCASSMRVSVPVVRVPDGCTLRVLCFTRRRAFCRDLGPRSPRAGARTPVFPPWAAASCQHGSGFCPAGDGEPVGLLLMSKRRR